MVFERVGSLLRICHRDKLQMQIVAALYNLLRQSVNELGVGRIGGDPHVLRLGREIKGGPDGAGHGKGAENGNEPGVAQKSAHAVAHNMF